MRKIRRHRAARHEHFSKFPDRALRPVCPPLASNFERMPAAALRDDQIRRDLDDVPNNFGQVELQKTSELQKNQLIQFNIHSPP